MNVDNHILNALADFKFRFYEHTERLFLADHIKNSLAVIRTTI